MAAKMSIGIVDSLGKRTFHMAQLRRNSRQRPDKKAGRKRPRPCDREDDEIVAAPDSRQTKLGLWESNLLSSTPDKSPVFSRSKLNKTNYSLNVSAISSISSANKSKSVSQMSLPKTKENH